VSWSALLSTIARGDDLERDEAAAAMGAILTGRATPARIAGLIVGLRLKGETVEEMTGMVNAMLEVSEPLDLPADAIDIVGTGGSSHRQSHALNVSTMACVVASAAGATVCKHGNRKATSTSGSFDFLETLGVVAELPGPQLARCIDEVGIGFAYARLFHPAMRHAGPVRAELGIATVFNVLGPLAHPGRVRRQVVGAVDDGLAAKMAAVLQNRGAEMAWVIAGADAMDELGLTGTSVIYEVRPGRIDRFDIAPEDVGLKRISSLDEIAGGDAERNVELFRAVLSGADDGPRRDVVVLNAAAGLVVSGLAGDLTEAVSMAQAAIDDGRAEKKLAALVTASAAIADSS
jgi:anthranilate phosphoribosyltransferase